MWHLNPQVHRNSERCLPETKQSTKTYENITRNKEKNAEMICNI